MQYNNISERLKQLRKELGLSQTDFGKKIGKNYHSVMRWELGKVLPPSNVLEYICDCFDVNIDWLTEGTGEMFSLIKINELSDFNKEYTILTPELFELYQNAAEMNGRGGYEYIYLPSMHTDSFALIAPRGATPPINKGDIALLTYKEKASEEGYYLIKDKYGDFFIRWYTPELDMFCSKTEDYPDIQSKDAEVIARAYKIIREISL
jgi:transcriptional regulator with XRE-family HTH domain